MASSMATTSGSGRRLISDRDQRRTLGLAAKRRVEREYTASQINEAVVAEYFGGLQNGLGTRITSAASNTAYPRAWAYVTAACGLGLLFYLAATALERIAMPWHTSR